MDILIDLVARVTIFFDSVNESLKSTYRSKAKLIRFIINMVYAIVISIIMGIFLQVFFIIIIAAFTGWNIISKINFFVMPLFLLLCFGEINYFNYRDENFSLPKKILHLYIILKNLNIFDGIWKTIGFTIINSIIIILLFGWMLSPFKLADSILPMVVLIMGIIALFITMLIYHEATDNEIDRKRKQFLIALIVFVGYLILNIYQMVKALNNQWNNYTIVFYSTTILGLLLSIITVIDKAREFYKIVKGTFDDEINEIIRNLYEQYSYKKGIKIINKQKSDIKHSFNGIQIIWILGSRKEKRNLLIYGMICAIFISFVCIFAYGNSRDKILDAINYLKIGIIKSIFGGNKELASAILILLITAALIARFTYYFVKNISDSDIIYKVQLICKIEICLIIVIACFKYVLQVIFIFLIKYVFIPLCALFMLSLIILSVLYRIKNK